MSWALMFVGPWVVLGSLAEKSRKKKCAGMFHVKIYVCHIESVPKVVKVLIPIKFIYFCKQSWYPITSLRRLLVKVGVEYLKFKYWLHIFKFFLLTTNFLIPCFLSHNYYCPLLLYKPKKCFTFFYTPYFFYNKNLCGSRLVTPRTTWRVIMSPGL